MTIAVGFYCLDGIVMAADSQEVVADYMKRSVAKIVQRPVAFDEKDKKPFTLFAGAGDGDFIDALIDKLWGAMEPASNIDEMAQKAEEKLTQEYARLASCLPPERIPEAELMMGLWAGGDAELVKVKGPNVIRRQLIQTIGCGLVLNTYIANHIVHPKTTFSSLVPLAVYMVEEAKENVHGVGGETSLITISLEGELRGYPPWELAPIKKRTLGIESALREAMAFAVDSDMAEDVFDSRMKDILGKLRQLRRRETGKP